MATASYPLFELCWLQGFKAMHNNEDEDANPYPPHSREAAYWSDGWWEAALNENDINAAFEEALEESKDTSSEHA